MLHAAPRRRQALSLLEMLIVLVILVTLAGMVVPLATGQIDHAEETVTQETCRRFEDAIRRYAADHMGLLPGFYPEMDEEDTGTMSSANLNQLFSINGLITNPETASSGDLGLFPGSPFIESNRFLTNLYDADVVRWSGPYIGADTFFVTPATTLDQPRLDSENELLIRSGSWRGHGFENLDNTQKSALVTAIKNHTANGYIRITIEVGTGTSAGYFILRFWTTGTIVSKVHEFQIPIANSLSNL